VAGDRINLLGLARTELESFVSERLGETVSRPSIDEVDVPAGRGGFLGHE
jgi:hypothetical protein